ncbi:MAG: single-stranded-DNA-specific exonuclease RecJ [Candidatus Buchananbacteria bacterium CG10_big_fil_rev_8_21_14_0_10_42_9]|uniref:Single-stranded-DNA-specific exonuclease RecJ n=1 Tax=Candidatus Buchananbacteria bacterium CG10_big_fil_rev_8_21_14_0_10_42_9 TaxID=1974526 RepID=A0A2H0W472_9BACT|nr:MAG: single-stranded-DNA-specific exonuclease RecJ [Candidatus Buchananbacteria bacterium CG10_big_fil_rev_8_21_14_0_10_42_9]
MDKIWQVAKTVPKSFKDKFPEINEIVLQLLYDRGLKTQEAIDQFLNPDYEKLHDPLTFRMMKDVVKRIFEAIDKKEKITVYGDYDADGVCASVLLMRALKEYGGNVDFYTPYRDTEGYGLNMNASQYMIEQGTNLVITVDCGTSNTQEVAYLKANNVDVIIIDHHSQPLDLPDALILNPKLKDEKYPYRFLASSGMTFKVLSAMIAEQDGHKVKKKLPEKYLKWQLDLVAISTVTDMMSLIGENRILVKYGLIVLEKTRKVGLQQLIKSINTNSFTARGIDTVTIGFQIGPRLNAAGRMDHASSAYELLMTDDKSIAREMAMQLSENNVDRQKKTEQIFKKAKAQVQDSKDTLLIALGDDWPIGLVGLVAGRLLRVFQRPTMVISKNGEEFIGSGRSIEQFDMTAELSKHDKLLKKYGGHPQACGFTIANKKNLDAFIKTMKKSTKDALKGVDLTPVLQIDKEVELDEINWELYDVLEQFEPHGMDNPKPKFLARKLHVHSIEGMGKNQNHIRVMISHNSDEVRKTIGFFMGEWLDKIKKGDYIDIVFEVGVNKWNGNRELELKIIDLKHSDG